MTEPQNKFTCSQCGRIVRAHDQNAALTIEATQAIPVHTYIGHQSCIEHFARVLGRESHVELFLT